MKPHPYKPSGIVAKLTSKPEKKTRTTLDTIEVTQDLVKSWVIPSIQRGEYVNSKVRMLVEELKVNGGIWPGIVTLGYVEENDDVNCYLIDGQQRRAAFMLSELPVGYADIRVHFFKTKIEMGAEFVRLNSRLVNMKPDDILRAMEDSTPGLKLIRSECPFVGYSHIRRSSGPSVSMSSVLRAWYVSSHETPIDKAPGVEELAKTITEEGYSNLVGFLKLAEGAWGTDKEYGRLWLRLNLTLCMWIYRRTVLQPKTPHSKTEILSPQLFQKCLMSLSASGKYTDWLVGRLLDDRERSPAFVRIKALFVKRLEQELGRKVKFISPYWSSKSGVEMNRLQGTLSAS